MQCTKAVTLPQLDGAVAINAGQRWLLRVICVQPRNLTSCLPNGERQRFADSRAEVAAAAATPESIDHVGCQFQSSLSSAERERLTSASLSARCDAVML